MQRFTTEWRNDADIESDYTHSCNRLWQKNNPKDDIVLAQVGSETRAKTWRNGQ